jgi:hypothetical protein
MLKYYCEELFVYMGYKRVSLTSIPTLPFAADVHPSAPTG